MKRSRAKRDVGGASNARPEAKTADSTFIKLLLGADLGELKRRYLEMFRQPPPSAFGPDLLRRSVAYRFQCQVRGGLTAETEKRIRAIAKQYEAKPDRQIEIKRKIKVGSEFVRTWKGKPYRVVVAADGYRYAGEIYASLSEIASLITGTNWNGPRFFGLRTKIVGDQRPHG